MYTCDDCNNLLLDLLYGLLEPDEAQGLREHLNGCPACQAALAAAEAQQALLGKAAQVYSKVPAFTAPQDEEAVATSLARSASEGGPPLRANDAPAAPRPRRRWAWAAVAAAVLLSAGGLYGYDLYEQGLAERRQEVAAARKHVQVVETQFAAAREEYREEAATLPAKVQARQVQVQVYGPANYRQDAPSQYHVVTKNLDGQPVATDVLVRASDAATGKPVFEQALKNPGAATLDLPAGLKAEAGSKLQLGVEVHTALARDALSQDLPVAGPAYATQLTVNKSVCRVREVLFFRSLTLERFSLKPPGRSFPLQFALVDSRGKEVKKLLSQSRHDGVGGGELALTDDLIEGEYTLRVSPADGAQAFPAQECRVQVVRDPAIELEFDRSVYRPGDTMNVQLYSRALQNGVSANANQPYTLTLKTPGAAAPAQTQTRANNFGYATFQAQVPEKAAAGKATVEVQVHDGKRNEKVIQQVPIAPARRTVEFFPEGGDLVVGVSNRVYFRVTTPPGEPADLQGRVVDSKDRAVADLKTAPAARPGERHRLGLFELTPQAGESYKLQVTEPKGVKEEPTLPAAAGTVALSIPDGVSREGEPVRVVLQTAAAERPLLVLASCRGQVVDEQFVSARPGKTELRLAPAPGSRGVLRVTVYEPRQGELVPLAERLVYQAPAQRLQLSFSREGKDAGQPYRPGEHVQWGLKAVTENGAVVTAATLGIAAVDERVLEGTDKLGEVGLPAFFYLATTVPAAENLEDADFLLSDRPAAKQALDLFLGTHGWRRFVRREPAAVVLAQADLLSKMEGRDGTAAEQPLVFNRDNAEAVRRRYAAELTAGQKVLQSAMLQRRADLQEERVQRLQNVRAAEAAQGEYEQAPREYLRLGLGIVAVLLLLTGALFLAVGFIRALRGRSSSTPAFATAFATLAVCALLYGLSGGLRVENTRDLPQMGPQGQMAQLDWRLPEVQTRAEERSRREVLDAVPVGPLSEVRPTDLAEKNRQAAVKLFDLDRKGQTLVRAAGEAQMQNQAMFLLRRQAEQARDDARQQSAHLGRLADRFAEAKHTQEAQGGATKFGGMAGRGGGAPSAPSSQPAPGGHVAPSPLATKELDVSKKGMALAVTAAVAREYKHERGSQGQDFQDTVLWHPALAVVNGRAQVDFYLSDSVTTYRVFLSGHDPSGRLGSAQGRIEVRPAQQK